MWKFHSLIKRRPVQCSIVALHWKCRILQLEIPARREIIEDLLRDGAIVLEASHDGASVDVIK